MKFDNLTRLGTDPNKDIGPGLNMEFGRWAGPPATNNYLGNGHMRYSMLTHEDFSTKYWDQSFTFATPTMTGIEYPSASNPPWTPVFSVTFGPRLSIGGGAGNSQYDRPTKGVLQNNPFITAVLSTGEKKWTNHPANLPFDFSIYPHEDGNSDSLPTDTTSEGYLFTGTGLADGMSRLILSALPMKPVASLVELQNWNLQGKKGIPPFQYGVIGNSDAHPLIQSASVLPSDPVTTAIAENLQHDDAYCANHLLFDDWFFSSIAPEPQNFGKTIAKDIDTVYREYLMGQRDLTNRAYRPIADDKALTTEIANQRITQILNSSDGWQKVASRFEVDGMFNINSTSVKAWRALLGHSREQQVARHTAGGITTPSTEYDYVVSRHNVASDVEASDATGMGATFPSGSQYAGFRTLTDTQLDDLADKIVAQVRSRGPFLSLSEFVNRQLSSDPANALAGTIQTALLALSDSPNEFLEDDDYASLTMDPDSDRLDGAGYAFKDAANGTASFGLPGWIRQADILSPIAPILSARDDTFTIRAYGDAKDANGNVTARAWCEATVRRTREFIDPTDSQDQADITIPPVRPMNQIFGRKYILTNFRWLSANEV